MNAFRRVVKAKSLSERFHARRKEAAPGENFELEATSRAQGNCHLLRGSTKIARAEVLKLNTFHLETIIPCISGSTQRSR